MAVTPSAKTIAFAVSVVRSKPEELSVGEYIRLLKQHVAKGKRDLTISSQHHHLDRSSYWRSEAERMKEVVKAWESHAIDLQKELDAAKNKADAARPSSPTKKRKKVDQDTVPVPRSPKKSRVSMPTPPAMPAFLHHPQADEFSQAGETGDILLRSVFHIHAIIRSNLKAEPLELAYHIQKASSALPATVLRHAQKANVTNLDDLKGVLNVAHRTVVSILVGFNRLRHVPGGSALQGRTTYAIVQMFKNLLSGLEQLSSADADTQLSGKSASSLQKQVSKFKAKAKPEQSATKSTALLSMYTTFICGLIDSLEPKLEANRSLFEGISYCVLDRLGSRLFITVFGHARGTTISDEILQSNETQDEIEDVEDPPLTETQLKQVRLEAPYLVHLLNKIMSSAPAYLGSTTSTKSTKAKSTKAASKGTLSIAAKECLQRTLVNGVFGVDEADDDGLFTDCMSMPLAGEDIPMPKLKDADVQEWFKEEVWRLLGWDILSHEKL